MMTKTKKQLLDNAPLVRRFLQSSPLASAVIDVNGTILFANNKLTDLLGYSSEELLGKSSAALFPNLAKCLRRAHSARGASQSEWEPQQHEQEVVLKSKNNQNLSLKLTLQPISGTVTSPCLAHFAHADTPRLDPNLLQSERLAAIAQMASGLAHESRNALQRAIACLDLLELDLKNDPEQMNLSQGIRNSLADLMGNYEEVRRYAEPITLRPQRVRLLHLCQIAFDEIAVRHEYFPHQLRFSCESEHADVAHVDREKMKLVCHHLIENAIDACEDIAEIDVHCERIMRRHDDAVQLTFHDHGHGFAAETLPLVFDPFYTTKQHGTGLGLAICRRIVEAHRGEIEATNHDDGGGMIYVTITADGNALSSPSQANKSET
ncbi:PAS/PAC sensor signal transduction histidine kinase [Rhodopirellula maiorica SM1]|uniref:histidine kinase n=1 Tax=Rhodopirellula maiorica SM1 TaxID=1265738 RepID=M5RAW3_9BACT|nr:ATP-binding protein [Rhodopirellula maiorica]EMI16515.1 PAS/PAC sensor signal transduction histidine kinase [Rhodopirellula maiorica SM1]